MASLICPLTSVAPSYKNSQTQAFILKHIMAPVATTERDNVTAPVKPVVMEKVYNPFYSPPSVDDGNESYKYANFKVRLQLSNSSSILPSKIFPSAFIPKVVLGATRGS